MSGARVTVANSRAWRRLVLRVVRGVPAAFRRKLIRGMSGRVKNLIQRGGAPVRW